jgi:hypothetical protein
MLHAREASDRAYTIHLPGATAVARIELSVEQTSTEWEVTALYDAARCEIHCLWRHKRDALGLAPLLAPPIAALRIYSNFVATPYTVSVDPAGLGLPGAMRDGPLCRAAAFLPARRLFVTSPAQCGDGGAPERPRAHFFSSTRLPNVISASLAPLRI